MLKDLSFGLISFSYLWMSSFTPHLSFRNVNCDVKNVASFGLSDDFVQVMFDAPFLFLPSTIHLLLPSWYIKLMKLSDDPSYRRIFSSKVHKVSLSLPPTAPKSCFLARNVPDPTTQDDCGRVSSRHSPGLTPLILKQINACRFLWFRPTHFPLLIHYYESSTVYLLLSEP
jgi:hypothetical protein